MTSVELPSAPPWCAAHSTSTTPQSAAAAAHLRGRQIAGRQQPKPPELDTDRQAPGVLRQGRRRSGRNQPQRQPRRIPAIARPGLPAPLARELAVRRDRVRLGRPVQPAIPQRQHLDVVVAVDRAISPREHAPEAADMVGVEVGVIRQVDARRPVVIVHAWITASAAPGGPECRNHHRVPLGAEQQQRAALANIDEAEPGLPGAPRVPASSSAVESMAPGSARTVAALHQT